MTVADFEIAIVARLNLIAAVAVDVARLGMHGSREDDSASDYAEGGPGAHTCRRRVMIEGTKLDEHESSENERKFTAMIAALIERRRAAGAPSIRPGLQMSFSKPRIQIG
jgi:hypothetical protein